MEIILRLSKTEADTLTRFIDVAVHAEGLAVAKSAVELFDKIMAAYREADAIPA